MGTMGPDSGVPLLRATSEGAGVPERFEVRLVGPNGNEFRYVARTRLGERKAIAMAVEAHVLRHDLAPIYDVRVLRVADGADDSSDLDDRHEY